MLPNAMGVRSDLGLSGDTLCDGGGPWSGSGVVGPTSVGVIGGHNAVG